MTTDTGMLRKDIFDGTDANEGVTARYGSTKARIERAALQLFARHGIDGVSIKQIAEACVISDGAMYRHFKSKEELARLMFEAIHAKLTDLVIEHLKPEASLEDTARALVTAYCHLADNDPAQFVYHLSHRNHFISAYGDGGADPSNFMSDMVKQAMEAGEISKGNPEIRSGMALGVVMQVAEYSLYGRIPMPLSDHIEEFVRGIMAVLRS